MGKWRDEVEILECGCKVGRSKGGVWFYDFLCEEHVKGVYEGKKYSSEKAEEMTAKLNEQMKMREAYKKLGDLMKQMSDTEAKAYLYIKKAKQPLAIRDMPHQLQGAVGKLLSKKLVERYRSQVKVSRHGFNSVKMTNCVRIVKK